MKNRSIAFMLVILASMLMSACANLRTDYESPRLQLAGIELLPSNNLEARFKLSLRLENPNREELNLAGVSYVLNLQGFDVIHGVGNNIPSIPAYDSREFDVFAQASLIQSIRLIRELSHNKQSALDYKMKLKLDTGGLWPALRIEDSGRIDLEGALSQ